MLPTHLVRRIIPREGATVHQWFRRSHVCSNTENSWNFALEVAFSLSHNLVWWQSVCVDGDNSRPFLSSPPGDRLPSPCSAFPILDVGVVVDPGHCDDVRAGWKPHRHVIAGVLRHMLVQTDKCNNRWRLNGRPESWERCPLSYLVNGNWVTERSAEACLDAAFCQRRCEDDWCFGRQSRRPASAATSSKKRVAEKLARPVRVPVVRA